MSINAPYHILKKYDGATLFGITDYNIQQILAELNKLEKSKNLITCTSWSKLFTNWYDQTNTIIQFPTILFQIYPDSYQLQEKELAPDPSSDRENLVKLLESGMLLVIENKSFSQPDNESETFWKSLQKALETNKRGIDGNVRILSIIAENFTYKKL
ncbi:hypothetical protein C1646_821524 [Rhizophagus diaphanus]|nr:hypothetical protein C1646_821524 [Rhizophagus diaphanus] [Rhizophagus sp. MUCL 43196]